MSSTFTGTVHVLGLPHTDVDPTWSTCAFTTKTRHLVRMLHDQDIPTVVYGSALWDHAGDHVAVYTEADRTRWFGAIDWRERVFDQWDLTAPCWAELNLRAAAAIRERVQPGDVLHLTMGAAHTACAQALPDVRAAELGVGYEASCAEFRVFESRAWQHHTYGVQGLHDGRLYDDVIPNAFDPDQFSTGDDDGFLLYLGRMTPRKGLAIVEELAKHHTVLTAGQGDERVPGALHLGPVGPAERRDLLAQATAVLCPTLYVEPFGGVVVEAQLSGVPAITTPFGAFPETVDHGRSGFLCHTLADFLDAAKRAPSLRCPELRTDAIERWSLDAVAPRYRTYLDRLATLDGGGWYTLP